LTAAPERSQASCGVPGSGTQFRCIPLFMIPAGWKGH